MTALLKGFCGASAVLGYFHGVAHDKPLWAIAAAIMALSAVLSDRP